MRKSQPPGPQWVQLGLSRPQYRANSLSWGLRVHQRPLKAQTASARSWSNAKRRGWVSPFSTSSRSQTDQRPPSNLDSGVCCPAKNWSNAWVSFGVNSSGANTGWFGSNPRDSVISPMVSACSWRSRSVDGLIGADFFRDRVVEIDYTAQKLRVLATSPPADATNAVPLEIPAARQLSSG